MMNNPSYLTLDKRATYENVNPDGSQKPESDADQPQYGGQYAAPESSAVSDPVLNQVVYDDFNSIVPPTQQAIIPDATEPSYLSPTIIPTAQHTYVNVSPDEVV